MRWARRWLFPILVILSTVVAVIYFLESRDRTPEQLILPDL